MPTRRYTAFLRAINVGGRTVKMARLRALFEQLDLRAVQTFIASGNVSFETDEGDEAALTARIENHLRATLGFQVDTFLRSPRELVRIAAHAPFGEIAAGDALYVALLRQAPDAAAVERLMAYRTAIDDFALNGRNAYWHCRKRMSESDFSGAKLEKALAMPATLRSITTMRKLAAAASEA